MNILHLDSSILATNSVSRGLTQALVSTLSARHAGAQVTYHDLAANEIPHLSGEILGAAFTDKADWSPLQQAEAARSDALIAEFLAADVLVIGAPMYNFGVPSQLKAWIEIGRAHV